MHAPTSDERNKRSNSSNNKIQEIEIMCKNEKVDEDPELRPFVMSDSVPTNTPASQPSSLSLPSSSSPITVVGGSDDGDNEKHQTTSNAVLALFTVFLIGGLYFSGVYIGDGVQSATNIFQSGDDDAAHDANMDSTNHHLHQQEQDFTIAGSGSSSGNHHHHGEYRPIDYALLEPITPKDSYYARDQIINLIINEYISPETWETDITDKIENAMDVLASKENDGEPVGIEGHDFLFVGSVGASLNEQSLRNNNITHIINWSMTARCNVFDGIEYLCVYGIRQYSDLKKRLDILDNAVDFIESARLMGGKALSHCWYGKNRSVTLLVAYLMKYEGMKRDDAIALIQRTRDIADPYLDVLHLYEKKYLK